MTPLVTPPDVDAAEAHARLDDPILSKYALEKITELPTWAQGIAGRVQQLRVQPGSRFESDDQLKPTEPPSEQVLNLLRSALDHLQALADAVASNGPRPLAGFTLIRSSIEASAIAAWLMFPGTKDARLRNSIRLSVENRKDTETYIKRFGGADKRVARWFVEEMTATKNQRPGTKDMDLERNFPTLTSILVEADRRQPNGSVRGLDAWRACSGIAHSNGQFGGATVSRVEGTDSIQVTVRPTALLMMLEPAQQYLEDGLGLAERHMALTPGRRNA